MNRSTPMMGNSTSAITTPCEVRRSTKFRHREVHPYVGLVFPLAAYRG